LQTSPLQGADSKNSKKEEIHSIFKKLVLKNLNWPAIELAFLQGLRHLWKQQLCWQEQSPFWDLPWKLYFEISSFTSLDITKFSRMFQNQYLKLLCFVWHGWKVIFLHKQWTDTVIVKKEIWLVSKTLIFFLWWAENFSANIPWSLKCSIIQLWFSFTFNFFHTYYFDWGLLHIFSLLLCFLLR